MAFDSLCCGHGKLGAREGEQISHGSALGRSFGIRLSGYMCLFTVDLGYCHEFYFQSLLFC